MNAVHDSKRCSQIWMPRLFQFESLVTKSTFCKKNKEFLGRTSQSFWVFEKGHKSVVKLVRV